MTNKIRRFWTWFASASPSLRARYHEPNAVSMIDAAVREMSPRIGWEMGPGGCDDRIYFALSPELRESRLEFVTSVISQAPVVQGVDLLVGRQPKPEPFIIQLGDSQSTIDARDWMYLPYRYPDGCVELVFVANQKLALNRRERKAIGALLLQNIYGEVHLLRTIDDWDVLDFSPAGAAQSMRPVLRMMECP